MIVSALAVYKKSMIRYSPASVYHHVPLCLYSNSWPLDRLLIPLALRYISIAIVVSP